VITNPEELNDLYMETFKWRLRHRPVQPENIVIQEELFKLRLELAKIRKTKPWTISDLENALKQLKSGKCRDPEGGSETICACSVEQSLSFWKTSILHAVFQYLCTL
jgi:hypothetical protein